MDTSRICYTKTKKNKVRKSIWIIKRKKSRKDFRRGIEIFKKKNGKGNKENKQ